MKFILLIGIFLMVSVSAADFGYNNLDGALLTPEPIPLISNISNVWNTTDQGPLTAVSQILTGDLTDDGTYIRNNFENGYVYKGDFETTTGDLSWTVDDNGAGDVDVNFAGVTGNSYVSLSTGGNGGFFQLYANPNPSVDYLLATITETQGADTEINFYEGGTGHNRFWSSGSVRIGGGADYLCSNLTEDVDCDTPATGADLVVEDDIWANGTIYSNLTNTTYLINSEGLLGSSCIGLWGDSDTTCLSEGSYIKTDSTSSTFGSSNSAVVSGFVQTQRGGTVVISSSSDITTGSSLTVTPTEATFTDIVSIGTSTSKTSMAQPNVFGDSFRLDLDGDGDGAGFGQILAGDNTVFQFQNDLLYISGQGATTGAEVWMGTTDTTIQSGHDLGAVYFRGTDSAIRHGAFIQADVDKVWGSNTNDAPTTLNFYTQSDGNTNSMLIERMSIDDNGQVYIQDATTGSEFVVDGVGEFEQVNVGTGSVVISELALGQGQISSFFSTTFDVFGNDEMFLLANELAFLGGTNRSFQWDTSGELKYQVGGVTQIKFQDGHSRFYGNVSLDEDNLLLKFGDNEDADIGYDGTNLIFTTNRTGNGIAWFSSNISAQDLIDRSWYWDNNLGRAVDFLIDTENISSDEDLNEFEKITYEITDFSRPEVESYEEEVCSSEVIQGEPYNITHYKEDYVNGTLWNETVVNGTFVNVTSWVEEFEGNLSQVETCINVTRQRTIFPYKLNETGRIVSAVVGKHEQVLSEITSAGKPKYITNISSPTWKVNSLIAEEIFTESKTIEDGVDYVEKINDKDKLKNKTMHPAFLATVGDDGESYELLSMEDRIVILEGSVNQIFTILCDKNILKKADGCL